MHKKHASVFTILVNVSTQRTNNLKVMRNRSRLKLSLQIFVVTFFIWTKGLRGGKGFISVTYFTYHIQ